MSAVNATWDIPWGSGKKASDIQSDITIADGKVTGTLNFIEGGLAPSGPLAGDGYFLALQWSDPKEAENVTSLLVGLEPSEGTGLVEAIEDTDRNGVFKVDPAAMQKAVLIQSSAKGRRFQYFDLSELEFAEAEEAVGT